MYGEFALLDHSLLLSIDLYYRKNTSLRSFLGGGAAMDFRERENPASHEF